MLLEFRFERLHVEEVVLARGAPTAREASAVHRSQTACNLHDLTRNSCSVRANGATEHRAHALSPDARRIDLSAVHAHATLGRTAPPDPA
jgi:hypothetical protein